MSYKVYRAVNDQATYALIAENVTETAYSYDLTDLAAGDQLVLRVTAVNVDGKENETEFFGFHIHQGKAAPGRIFPVQAVIMTLPARHILSTQETCRHYWPVGGMGICP